MSIVLNNVNMIDSDTRHVYAGNLYMLSQVLDIATNTTAYVLLDTRSSTKLNHLRLINIASDADINFIQMYEVENFAFTEVSQMPIENLNRLSNKTSDVIGKTINTTQGLASPLIDFRALNNGYISQPVYEGEMILNNTEHYVFVLRNEDLETRKYVLNIVFYQTEN